MRVVVELTDREADMLLRDPERFPSPAAFCIVDRERESALDKVRDAILKARVAV